MRAGTSACRRSRRHAASPSGAPPRIDTGCDGCLGGRARRDRRHPCRDGRRRNRRRRRPAIRRPATDPRVARRREQPRGRDTAHRPDCPDQERHRREPTAPAPVGERRGGVVEHDGRIREELILRVDAKALARDPLHRSASPPRAQLVADLERAARDSGIDVKVTCRHACDRKPGGEIRGSRPRARGWASPRRRPSNRWPAALGVRPMRGGIRRHRSVPLSAPTRQRRSDTRTSPSSSRSRRRRRARWPSLRHFSCDQPVRRHSSSALSPASCDARARR